MRKEGAGGSHTDNAGMEQDQDREAQDGQDEQEEPEEPGMPVKEKQASKCWHPICCLC